MTMDDTGTRMRANMDKVLRALDVVPPYSNGRATDGDNIAPTARASGQARTPRQSRSSCRHAADASPQGPAERATGEIRVPEFDLGERILAEQRRITGRKRKAPGTPDEAKHAGPSALPTTPLAVPSGEDLVQLHRVVADIVSRDIERLCTGAA